MKAVTAPAEPAPAQECQRVRVELGQSVFLASSSETVALTIHQPSALPAGAMILLYRSDGARRAVPLSATVRTTGRTSFVVGPDIAAGTYQVGIVDAAATRWVSFGPRPTMTVVPSKQVGALVVVEFGCDLDVEPVPGGVLAVRNPALQTTIPLKLVSKHVDNAGVTRFTYGGRGLAPTGPVSLMFGPGVPAKAWLGPHYKSSANCRSHARFLTGVALQSGPTRVAPPRDGWQAAEVRESTTSLAATFTTVYPWDNGLVVGGNLSAPAPPVVQLPCE